MNALLLALTTLVGQVGEPRPVPRPANPGQFYVSPDVETSLRWEFPPGAPARPVEVVVHDATGSERSRVRALRAGDRGIEAAVRPARGYAEVSIPETGQRFGLLALPAWEGKADPFFAIDGALSWLVREDPLREALIAASARGGLAMIRERLTAGAVHPGPDRWDWQTPQRFDALRQSCRKHGVEVLEMAHDAPAWLGRVDRYPDDLVGFAALWTGLAGRWRPTWGAVEVWNEPDIFFGGDLPADQYVPLVKSLAFGFRAARVDVPLVGGATAAFKPLWMRSAARNGVLDDIDVFSFHTYGSALQMEGLVSRFRGWLREHGRGAMPLWITECGRPWDRGPERPTLDQDARSALDVAMKAVEARACGIERYFAFVLPFYEEDRNNFGLTDRQATPLLSFAAYAQCARALAGRSYLGDLRPALAGVSRARVFGGPASGETVAVLYTGKADPAARVDPGPGVVRCVGIDGRRLAPDADGKVPIPDGLVYVWFDRRPGPDRIVVDTPARAAHADGPATRRGAPSAVVLRYQFDPARVATSSEGYRAKDPTAPTLSMKVRVFNLGTTSRIVRLSARLDGAAVRPATVDGLTVGPRATAEATFTVETAGAFDAAELAEVVVEAREGPARLDRLVVSLLGEPDLARWLTRHPGAVEQPVTEPSRWSPNHSPGEVSIESAPSTPWRLRTSYASEGDHWAYPYFRLTDAGRLGPDATLVLRARCTGQASARLFAWEGDGGVGYITPGPIVPSDGRWHVARVRVADLVPSAANALDPDGKLDPSAVRRLSIGLNARGGEATLEVSDLYVVDDDAP